jgi:hypothetical protein
MEESMELQPKTLPLQTRIASVTRPQTVSQKECLKGPASAAASVARKEQGSY